MNALSLPTPWLNGKPLRLLILEDEPADAELIIRAIEGACFPGSCRVINKLADLKRELKTHSWDMVLSDFYLEGFTAYDVLDYLGRSAQPTPVILITGSLGEEAAVACVKAGIKDYVLKDNLNRLPGVIWAVWQDHLAAVQQQLQLHQTTITNQILRGMQGKIDLDDVLQTTVDLLHAALQLSRCIFFMPSREGTFPMRASCVSHQTANGQLLIGAHCPLLEYYHRQYPDQIVVAVDDLSRETDPQVLQSHHTYQVRSFILVKLVHQGRPLGGLCLHQCDRQRSWSVGEVELLKDLAAYYSLAIYQAQLFRRLQEQVRREQLLHHLSQALNSQLTPESILQATADCVGEYFQVDQVAITATVAPGQILVREWRLDQDRPAWQEVTAALGGLAELLQDPTLPHFCFLKLKRGSAAVILRVPIIIQGEWIGYLFLLSRQPEHRFGPEDIRLLERLVSQLVVALTDLRNRQILEQLVQERTRELQAASQAKSDFLSIVSHELRTPLTGILGFSRLLEKQIFGPLNPKQLQYVENILSCSDHLLDLINDLLDLSKIEAGQEELCLTLVVVRECCEACFLPMREKAAAKGLSLNLFIDPQVSTCRADRRRLQQILANLIGNGVKFTDRGSVTLRVEKQPGWIYFHVQDTGIGIAAADYPRLFQPFSQIDQGANRHYEGTGLGLSLSMHLACLHGGTITVESSLGQGSCFTLHLPDL